MNDTTFVTALYDLGRGDIDNSFKREFSTYLENFKKLLDCPINLVVYCDDVVEKFILERKNISNVFIIKKSLNQLQAAHFKDRIEVIRKRESWLSQAGWLRDSPQAVLEYYNVLVFSKLFMLNDCSVINHFNSSNFYWIDAGIHNTYNFSSDLKNTNLISKINAYHNGFLFLRFPYTPNLEIHGFCSKQYKKLCDVPFPYVCRGGFFGGHKTAISKLNSQYYQLLNDTLASGYMGTEETLFSILSSRNSDFISFYDLRPDGLIYRFFQYIINSKKNDIPLAVYVLTYNTPKQLRIWLREFYKNNDSNIKYKLYLFNNTDDQQFSDEYDSICNEYKIDQYKLKNIGINPGRQAVAEHFHSAPHDFYVFFEDDMLFQKFETPCKNGFSRNHTNILDTSIKILRKENLDYIKLNYSEVFGDNSKNWAWINMPDYERPHYFNNPDYNQFSKISKISSEDGIPYAIGEFHYCNWPIVFSKEGNKKLFIDFKNDRPTESGWMVLCQKLVSQKTIKPACLLAGPIFHNRIYNYEKRKEN